MKNAVIYSGSSLLKRPEQAKRGAASRARTRLAAYTTRLSVSRSVNADNYHRRLIIRN